MEKVISMWNNQGLKIVIILFCLPLFGENKNYIISSEYLQNNLNSRPCVDSVVTSLPFFHEGVLEAGMEDGQKFKKIGVPQKNLTGKLYIEKQLMKNQLCFECLIPKNKKNLSNSKFYY